VLLHREARLRKLIHRLRCCRIFLILLPELSFMHQSWADEDLFPSVRRTRQIREKGEGVEPHLQGWRLISKGGLLHQTKQNKKKQKKLQRDLSIAEQYRVQGCDDPSGTGSVTPSQPHDIGMAIRAAVHRKYLVSIERRTIHSP